MTKLKTSDGGQIYRTVSGSLRVLEQEDDFLFRVELKTLNTLVNRNNWQYLNLEEHRELFANTPILIAYVNNGAKVGDGHNFQMKRDKTGREYASFMAPNAERISGWFPEGNKIRIENIDGVDWIVGEAKIWAWYNRELVDLLKSAQGVDGMSVSIETLITEMHMNGDTEVYTRYKILGTTILGKGVNPAVENAHIRALSVDDGLNEFKLKVAAYEDKQSKDKNGKKGVTRLMNKQQKSNLQKQFPDYRVLAASEDGLKVALLSKSGDEFYTYEFGEGETTVVPERLKTASLNTAFKIGDAELEVSVNEITEALGNELKTASELAKENGDLLEKANAAIKERDEKEGKRRVQAVKESVKAALKKFNETQPEDEKVDETVCADIEKEADAGAFGECSDKGGLWNGDSVAVDKLLAACAKKVQEFNAERIRKNSTKGVYAWDSIRKNSENKTGIDGLLSRVNK